MHPNSISRRRFAQLLGAGAAISCARPTLSLARESAASRPKTVPVRLSSNENPFGPSPKARQAIANSLELACRYPDDHADLLLEALAKKDGVAVNQVLLGAGSGEILKICASAFTGGEERGMLVAADPTFEAIIGHASRRGAEVIKIPLTSSYGHDLEKMAASAKGGLVYVCNPNNPTASITPKEEIRAFLDKVSPSTMVLVDEAYHHFVENPGYESVIPLIKQHPNLVVARTFSKIYGMAGMRCGYCVAQPEVIERLRPHQLSDSVNIMALVAAIASLEDVELVDKGRRLNTETRAYVNGELTKMGYGQISSEANFIMIDLKRPVVPLIQAMKERNVYVGRLFPALPNHMRVTIGKKPEMQTFLHAFREVTA